MVKSFPPLPPVPPSGRGYTAGGSSGPTPIPDAQTLSNLGNDLWLSTAFLIGQYNQTPSPQMFQIAMQSINRFMAQFPASGSGPDQTTRQGKYLYQLWVMLTTGDKSAGIGSLADLAADSSASYSAADYQTFVSQYTNSAGSFNFVWNGFYNEIQAWGGTIGAYMPTAPHGMTGALDNLLSDFPFGHGSNTANFVSDIGSVLSLLNKATPPLDGVCQFLSDLINTPIDPSTKGSPSLATIDAAELDAAAKSNPNLEGELQNAINKMFSMGA